MKIFLTGATGYIGGSVAHTLQKNGHTVTGLVRSQEKADAIKRVGMTPVVGTLEDHRLLRAHAQASDAVIHTADADNRDAVTTFLAALAGTGKMFIHTSGSSIVGDDAQGMSVSQHVLTEDMPFVPMDIRQARHDINQLVRIEGIRLGVRTMVITPPMIYGDGLGITKDSDQLPKLIAASHEAQAGVYVGTGVNRWSNVHIADLADLYALALLKGTTGMMLYAENGEASFHEIAIAISHQLGFGGKTQALSMNEAIVRWGEWARYALGSNSRVVARNARELLGWQPLFSSMFA